MDSRERPLAREVGDAFEEQYYYVMKDLPEKVDKFYKDISTITRPGHDGTMRTSSLSDIGESLNPLTSGGFDSVVVTSVISHACSGGSVMVTVTGYFILKGSVEKNFIQTFLLAPQEKGYFVFTDLLVFVDKPEANVGTKVDSEASIPPANNETEVTGSEVAGDELKDVSKLSLASVSPRREEAEAVVDRGDKNNEDWHGIIIKNLHPKTTNTKVHNAFQQFGEIARVINRLPPLAHRVVLFIEEDSVHKAKQASPIMIDGHKVTVEKLFPTWGDRRTRGRGTRGRGTRGRGRGSQRWTTKQ